MKNITKLLGLTALSTILAVGSASAQSFFSEGTIKVALTTTTYNSGTTATSSDLEPARAVAIQVAGVANQSLTVVLKAKGLVVSTSTINLAVKGYTITVPAPLYFDNVTIDPSGLTSTNTASATVVQPR